MNIQFKLANGKSYDVPFTLVNMVGYHPSLKYNYVRAKRVLGKSLQKLSADCDVNAIRDRLFSLRGYENNFTELKGEVICRQAAKITATAMELRDEDWNYSKKDIAIILQLFTDAPVFSFTKPDGVDISFDFFKERAVVIKTPHPTIINKTFKRGEVWQLSNPVVKEEGNTVTVTMNHTDKFFDPLIPRNSYGKAHIGNIVISIPSPGIYNIPEISGAIFNVE